MKQYFLKNRKIFGVVGSVVALAIATLYFFIVPEEAISANGIFKIILSYGHSACWILLSLVSLLWGMDVTSRVVSALAYAALCIYVLFVGTMLVIKFA